MNCYYNDGGHTHHLHYTSVAPQRYTQWASLIADLNAHCWWRHNWKSAQVVNSYLVCDPTNPTTGFRPSSATMVSAEPFSHGTGTLRCLQKEMATYRQWSVSLWRDPDDVKHCGACRRKWRLTDTDLMSLWRDPLDVSHCQILFPDKTERRLSSATLCGWKRCFVADQLW